GVPHHLDAPVEGELRGRVARSVVHHQHVVLGRVEAQLVERAREAPLLVERRDDEEHPAAAPPGRLALRSGARLWRAARPARAHVPREPAVRPPEVWGEAGVASSSASTAPAKSGIRISWWPVRA